MAPAARNGRLRRHPLRMPEHDQHFRKILLREPKRAFAKARGGIIAATSGIQREIERWYGEKSAVICEVGAPPSASDGYARREPGRNLRICWSGAHLPRTGLPLLLHALAKLPVDASWEVSILGEGPCTAKWKRLAQRLGIDGRCTWTGHLSREDALDTMGRSHVFVITSLKDLTSTVLLEALSRGLPVICPNHLRVCRRGQRSMRNQAPHRQSA